MHQLVASERAVVVVELMTISCGIPHVSLHIPEGIGSDVPLMG